MDGEISVVPANDCGEANATTLSVESNNIPNIINEINGDMLVCVGETQVYWVEENPDVDNYIWTLPNGWIGNSSSNSIEVIVGDLDGEISVVPTNNCGEALATSLSIQTKTTPAAISAILGEVEVCENSSQQYSVENDANVDQYIWTLPSGWTGNSVSHEINVNVGENGGEISVVAENICGISTSSSLATEARSIPNPPSSIIGPQSACYNSLETFMVENDNNVDYYNWILPNGWSGNSSTNSLEVNIGNEDGIIYVNPINICGSGSSQSIVVESKHIPSAPDSIFGNTLVCEQSNQLYEVEYEPEVSYNWEFPSDWAGSSQNNTLNLIPSCTDGNISISVSNECGSSENLEKWVESLEILGSIGHITGNDVVCAGDQDVLYSVDDRADVDIYVWTLPYGAIIDQAGQESQILVDYGMSAVDGTISVQAENICGLSELSNININVDHIPAKPGFITGPQDVNEDQLAIYSVEEVLEATNYRWYLHDSWELEFGGNTPQVSIYFPLEAQNGDLMVAATNHCGASDLSILSIEISPVGLEENHAQNPLKAYPNPAKNQIYLCFEEFQLQDIEISIHSLDGQLVWKETRAMLNKELPIDVSHLSPASYIITAEYHQKVNRFKMVISR